jgi:hypothetical protein
MQKLVRFYDRSLLHDVLIRTGKQAAAFHDRFGALLSDADREKARAFAGLIEQGSIMKRYLVIRHGFLRTGFIRNVSLFLRM